MTTRTVDHERNAVDSSCRSCSRWLKECPGQPVERTRSPVAVFTVCDGCKIHGKYSWCGPNGC